jgi:hypothetical protein
MLLDKRTCFFKKRNGIQHQEISGRISLIFVNCDERKEVKKAFKNRDFFALIVKRGNVFGRTASFKIRVTDFVSSAVVFKAYSKYSRPFSSYVTSLQNLSATSSGIFL